MTEDRKLDLPHLRRIAAILEALPDDCDLPHAIVALEDAMVACHLGLRFGITLQRVRAENAEILREETAQQQGGMRH